MNSMTDAMMDAATETDDRETECLEIPPGVWIKHGFQLTATSRNPLTLLSNQMPPVCPDCGENMKESVIPISSPHEMERLEGLGLREHPHDFEIGDNVYSWYCGTPACQRKRYAILRSQQAAVEDKTLTASPETVLTTFGIGRKYQHCTLEGYQGFSIVLDRARKYVANPERGSLFLTGPTGVGKTHLAIGIMRDLAMKRVKNMKFVTAAELLLDLRSSFSEKSTSREEKIVSEYVNYTILTLDDLCAEKTTDYAASSLYMILNARLSDLKPTIVTSNFSRQDIAEVMPRVASRLAEYEIWDFTGTPDYRRNRK